MVTEVRPVQPPKAPPPISVTELGIVIQVNPEQPSKAKWPISVAKLGMITEVKLVHSLKAPALI